MKYAISSGARHLIGRLDKNDKTDDFIEALEEVCNKEHIRAGFFTAVGAMSSAELQLYAAETRDYTTRFEVRHDPRNALEVVSLTGHISAVGTRAIVRAHASLAYLSVGGQLHTVGGLLRRSRVLMCEYCITFFHDVQMQCKRVQGTDVPMIDFNPAGARGGRDFLPELPVDTASAPAAAPWHVAEPQRIPEVFAVGKRPAADEPPEPPEPAQPESGATDAAEDASPHPTEAPAPASADMWSAAIAQANPPPPGPPEPKIGDVLLHPRFGDCLIISFANPRAVVVQQLESQATHQLSLDEFIVRFIKSEGERGRFKLKPLPPAAAPLPPDNGMGLRVRPRTGRSRVAEEDLEQFPSTEDLVEHPKWGLCDVLSSDEDKDVVELRPRQGSNTTPREVSLKTFNILFDRHEEAQKVLRLELRDKRAGR